MTVASRSRRSLPVLLVLALLAAVLAALPAAPAQAVAPAACGTGAQNGLTVAATHGSAFYVDLKSSPKLDASYIGYRVTNTSTARQDLWVSLGDFTGSSLALANPRDAQQQVPVLDASATKTAYFLLKAAAEATSAQSHVVQVWQGNPTTTQALPLYSCTFTFNKVQATIKAAANKVTNVTTSISGTPQLGQPLTVTVAGDPGVIGAGDTSSTGDGEIIWLSPTAFSSWPSRALRLQAVSLTVPRRQNCGGGSITYVDRLLIKPAGCHSQQSYTATYTFTVIGRTTAPVKVAPVAQIASGAQYKHTDINGSASVTLDLSSVATPVVIEKTVTETSSTPVSAAIVGVTGSGDYGLVSYRITGTTTSTTGLSLDAVVDVPDAGIVYRAGTARVTAVGRTAEPLEPVRTTGSSEQVYTGPFVLTSTVPFRLDYEAYVPLTPGTYRNHAYAVVGDQQVGADPSTLPAVDVTATGGILTAVEGIFGMAPSALTQAPARVAKTTATLAGLVDANGTPTSVSFRLGTSASGVAGSTYSVVTADPSSTSAVDAVAVTAPLTGLTASTTYYYRVVAGTTLGDVLSFTTSDATALEITTTSLPDGLLGTAYSTQLTYGPTLTSPVWSVIRGTLPTGITLNTTTGALTGTPTTAGSGTVTVEVANGSTADGCTSGCATVSASAELTLLVRSSLVAPVPTTQAATQVVGTSAVLNGDVLTGGGAVTPVFLWGTDQALTNPTSLTASPSPLNADGPVSATVTGLVASTTYWYRLQATSSAGTASGTILSFTTGVAATLPVASTGAASAVGAGTGTVSGSVTTGGGSTTLVFRYGTASDLSGAASTQGDPGVRTDDGSTSAVLVGLQPVTTYYYELAATNGAGTSLGGIQSFTTGAAVTAPVATTLAASAVGPGTATVSGSVTTGGGSTTLVFRYGTASDLTGAAGDPGDPAVRTVDGSTSAVLSGLQPATTYFYRLVATNSVDTSLGTIESFTTTAAAPQVTTVAASQVGHASAVLGVLLTSTGGASASLQVEWGTSSTLSGATVVAAAPMTLNAPGSAAATLTGLPPSTTHYFRAVATGTGGTAFGQVLSFVTSAASSGPAPIMLPPAPGYVPVAPPAPAEATESDSDTSTAPDEQAEATAGPLTATGTGVGGITVGRVPQQAPSPAPGAGPDSYFSVDVDGENQFVSVELRLTQPTAGSLFWWDGTSWKKLEGTVRDGDALVVVIDATTRPGLTDLQGLQLAYGSTPTTRISGVDRQATAIAASRAGFPVDGSARSVVVARSDVFADALTGGPLAVREHGPILLSSTAGLSPAVATEVTRVLGGSGTVYLLGQERALAPAVADAVRALGYRVVRLGGADRYATAVEIAAALGHPDVVFEATGLDFADAVAAGAAAVAADGAVLLTAGATPAAATTRYLDGRTTTRYAVGGDASAADAGATALVGADRYDTAVLVATRFFPAPSGVGIAVGTAFPDPLVAVPYLARQGHPLLLVAGALNPAATSYLQERSSGIGQVTVFGGMTAVSEAAVQTVVRALP